MRHLNIILKYLFFSLLLLTILNRLYAQNRNTNFCGIKNHSFQAGEELKYVVYYNLSAIWVAAGEAKFSTKISRLNNKIVYHIVGDGATYKSYDWIFKVKDKYQTYIDTTSLLPLQFIRDVNEGGYKIYNNVNFDHDKNIAHSDNKEFKIPDCIQDVLSTIYYARNINYNQYKVGAKIPFSMFLDNEVFNLYIRYLGKVKINTKYGQFNAIKIAPLLIEGTIFKGGEQMVVYVSDDENHIPLRVESPILVGSIKVDMMDYKNLRYPLVSLIKKK